MQDQQIVNLFKGLVIDGVNKSQSGHPGGPMSSMDLTYLLFSEYLKFDPEDPKWMGRDRFILSAGHMSMLQYVMLYAVGYLTMDDLKQFRQLDSKTPGHPENFMTPGVECTTGPLGQGAAMSVGFAAAATHLAAKLDPTLFGYKTIAIVSDGDLQEGVAMEAASMAGHLKLNNLVWIYDKNHVQLSGPTKDVVSDDDQKIYEGFGWKVLRIDGHDHAQIRKAYDQAITSQNDRPVMIIADTVIGKGTHSLEHSYKSHGAPLGADERTKSKEKMGLPTDRDFYFTDEALKHFRRNFDKLKGDVRSWKKRLDEKLADSAWKQTYSAYFDKQDYQKLAPVPWKKDKQIPTRNAFGDIIEHWAHAIPNLIGGSADLAKSNMTHQFAEKVGDFNAENRLGRSINFGVREFPMSAMCNGIALHGGFVPFDATFLAFADYSRPALRLGALQQVRVIHEFTHDSFYLGEDGPTHQPIEQVMALRLIPDFYVMRPADPQETEVLMRKALELGQPSALCLTRQKVPYLDLPKETLALAAKGAYAVVDCANPEMIIVATGSEVSLAIDAAKKLGGKIKVVSMPCWELFMEQPKDYRDKVLDAKCTRRVSIEAGTTLGWDRFVGMDGLKIGIDHFGASAPAEVLAVEYGFTTDKVVERIRGHRFE